MSNNLYVTATEARSCKSAIILGVMQMIIREISSIIPAAKPRENASTRLDGF